MCKVNCNKCAKLEALFEQGDRCDKENSRPTSVLPYVSKLIERFVHLRLYGHLAQSNLLFDEQFGFRQRRYTATAPCQFNDDLLNRTGPGSVHMIRLFGLQRRHLTLWTTIFFF